MDVITMGGTQGAIGSWFPKYIIFICEYDEVVETQTIMLYLCNMHNVHAYHTKFSPQKFLANSVPARGYSWYTTLKTLKVGKTKLATHKS